MMSVAVAEGCFLSALQPNSSCTAYVVPSDGPSADPGAKARRVREQVRMRLAEKKSSSLPRLDDSQLGSTGERIALKKKKRKKEDRIVSNEPFVSHEQVMLIKL